MIPPTKSQTKNQKYSFQSTKVQRTHEALVCDSGCGRKIQQKNQMAHTEQILKEQ